MSVRCERGLRRGLRGVVGRAAGLSAERLVERLEERRLFAVTVADPIEDFTVRASSPVQTVQLGGVFATNNLDLVTGSVVRMPVKFGLGTNAVDSAITIELFDQRTPISAQNFLNYVNANRYENMIIHRVTRVNTDGIAVIQGGGFTYTGGQFGSVQTNAAIVNEFSSSPRDSQGRVNVRGTLSMARTSDRNSGTSQWFINTADNTSLDNSAQGNDYAVFGRVVGGLDVVDRIAAATVFDASSVNSAFGALPLPDYNNQGPLQPANVVTFNNSRVIPANQVKTTFTYSVSSSNNSIVTPTIDSNNQLRLTYGANKLGTATITLTAADLTGAAVSETFVVTVSSPLLAVTYNKASVVNRPTNRPVDLGGVLLGQTGGSTERTFSIRNTGNGVLQISDVQVPEGLRVVQMPAASVAAGATTTLVVGLKSDTEASVSGTISIISNVASVPFTIPVVAFASSGVTLGGTGLGAASTLVFDEADGSRATLVASGGRTRLTFTGTGASLSISARGVATVSGTNLALASATFLDNSPRSSLAASVRTGTISLGSLTATSAVRSVNLRGVILAGPANLAAGATDLTVAGLNAATLTAGAAVRTINLGEVIGSTVALTGNVTTLTASTVTASQISVTGNLGRATLQTLISSSLSSSGLSSLTLNSRNADAFSASTINATAAGTIALGRVTTAGAKSTFNAASIARLSGRNDAGRAFSLVKITPATTDVDDRLAAAGISTERLEVNVGLA